jgi:regulator of sigma E protease
LSFRVKDTFGMELLSGWVGLILGFSGLIFVHEFGHFILAKWNGVRVYVFSLGMGPYLVSFTWRETVYVLSLIPIGGYVKLAGQDDMNANLEPTKDPHDYRNKRPGQKAAILAAGAIFNLIFALLAFATAYTVGMDLTPARIGRVVADKPLASAKMYPIPADRDEAVPADLKEGDRIVEVGDTPVKSFLETVLEIAGSPSGHNLLLKVQRQNGKSDYVVVETETDKKIGASGIGLVQYDEPIKLNLGFTTEDSFGVAGNPADAEEERDRTGPAAKAGLRSGDVFHSMDGKAITDFASFVKALQASKGRPITLRFARGGDELPFEVERKKVDLVELAGTNVDRATRRIRELSPASEAYRAGLRNGDEIRAVDDKEVSDYNALVAALKAGGKRVKLAVWHDAEELVVDLTPMRSDNGRAWRAGVGVNIIKRVVTGIDPESAAYKGGLRTGCYVFGFDPDQPNAQRWTSGNLLWTKKLSSKEPETTHLDALPLNGKGYTFIQERRALEMYKAAGWGDALATAWDDTIRFSGNVFATLRGLITRDINPKALSGPAGIGNIMYTVASKQTFINYLWFLGFISLNLGVLQFIPIPLLDGFHLVMVFIEKLKGSPVAPKVQEAFQYVGIFIVGGLLLLATYNDIARFLFPNY